MVIFHSYVKLPEGIQYIEKEKYDNNDNKQLGFEVKFSLLIRVDDRYRHSCIDICIPSKSTLWQCIQCSPREGHDWLDWLVQRNSPSWNRSQHRSSMKFSDPSSLSGKELRKCTKLTTRCLAQFSSGGIFFSMFHAWPSYWIVKLGRILGH